MRSERLETGRILFNKMIGTKRLENAKKHINKVGVKNPNEIKLRGKWISGDVVWVRIRGNLWWPALVVDANMVSKSNKPKTKLPNDVLVRLYGTYTYVYRDPVKCCSDFVKIFEQSNGSSLELFEKSLEQDISNKKPSTLKRSDCEPEVEEAGDEVPKDKRPKHNAAAAAGEGNKSKQNTNMLTDQKFNSPGSVTPSLKVSSSSLSVRRIKVMQNLGLVAPLGSPFQKNGGLGVV